MKNSTVEIEKPVTSNPLAKPAPPTPLAVCNGMIADAKERARKEGLRLTRVWMDHRNSTATIPANASIVEEITAQTAHTNEQRKLRSASQNFSPQAFESALLDVEANRHVLADALAYLRRKHDDVLKAKAQPAAPDGIAPKKRSGLIGTIEAMLGDPVEPEPPRFPEPHKAPSGGLFGTPEPLNVPAELIKLQETIAGFPISVGFEKITGDLNAVASALHQAEPPPPLAPRMDKGWVVPSRF